MSSLYTWYPQIVWDVENGEDVDLSSMEAACEEIHEAMEGWGTDENTLTDVLGSKSAEDRYIISKQYVEMYETSLYDELGDETGGDYGKAIKLLALSPPEAEAKMVQRALKGAGAREQHLIPLLVARSNPDITLLKRAYFEMYGSDMVSDLSENLSGDLEKLLVMCAQGIEDNYDPEDTHTEDRVMEDTDAFYEAGQGSWGTDENQFFSILVNSPALHLQAINEAYVDKYGYSLKKAAEKEMGGDAEDAVLYLIGIKLAKTAETLATGIKMTTKGFGTDEIGLMNYIIRLSVFPRLLEAVKESHVELFEKTLEDRVEDEVGGDFKDLLLLLMKTEE